jgi:hypothetical protein
VGVGIAPKRGYGWGACCVLFPVPVRVTSSDAGKAICVSAEHRTGRAAHAPEFQMLEVLEQDVEQLVVGIIDAQRPKDLVVCLRGVDHLQSTRVSHAEQLLLISGVDAVLLDHPFVAGWREETSAHPMVRPAMYKCESSERTKALLIRSEQGLGTTANQGWGCSCGWVKTRARARG